MTLKRKVFYKLCIIIIVSIVIESLGFISSVLYNSVAYVNPFSDIDPHAQKYSY